ncbi:MAG: glycosyltransferase [Gammaproteobacteria bacterium]|nr:glycosyltransferase [Gammaproteobacteria bacterium]
MTNPLVSVLVPVFNNEEFLHTSIQSLTSQSLEEFEVIIADDNSGDESMAVSSKLIGSDPRFRFIFGQMHCGMTRNWNRALREATGKYIAKLDADDAFAPRTLELLVKEMEQTPDTRATFCRTVICDENLEPMSCYRGDQGFLLQGLDPLSHHLEYGHRWYKMCFDDIQLWHSNALLYRKDYLVGLGGWDEKWSCAADTDLILRTLEKNDSVAHIPYAGVKYRIREGSVSNTFRKRGWLAIEGTVLHLLSLVRYSRSGGRLDFHLRKAWWRFWKNFQDLVSSDQEEMSGYPDAIRLHLSDEVKNSVRPPMRVLLEGIVRQRLWELKQVGQ